MKKNKKNEILFSDLLFDLSNLIAFSDLDRLLKKEYSIKLKKAKGEKLTADEEFFSTYLIQPSTLLSFLTYRKKGD